MTGLRNGFLIILLPLLLSACLNSGPDYSGTDGDDLDHYDSQPRTYSFPQTRPATGKKVFIFDPHHTMWGAYNAQGQLVSQGPASGGRDFCSDVGRPCLTPRGNFKVHRKGSADCVSTKYPLGEGGAPMPHCMFFHRGYAIHGSYDVPNYNASHGCIRVTPNDAAWLSQNFIDVGTRVIVQPY